MVLGPTHFRTARSYDCGNYDKLNVAQGYWFLDLVKRSRRLRLARGSVALLLLT